MENGECHYLPENISRLTALIRAALILVEIRLKLLFCMASSYKFPTAFGT